MKGVIHLPWHKLHDFLQLSLTFPVVDLRHWGRSFQERWQSPRLAIVMQDGRPFGLQVDGMGFESS